jgi:hypothetical protein
VLEAEEIVKEVEEISTSTPTSTEGVVLSPVAPVPPPAPLATPEPPVEEGEMVTETDTPLLTGNHGDMPLLTCNHGDMPLLTGNHGDMPLLTCNCGGTPLLTG